MFVQIVDKSSAELVSEVAVEGGNSNLLGLTSSSKKKKAAKDVSESYDLNEVPVRGVNADNKATKVCPVRRFTFLLLPLPFPPPLLMALQESHAHATDKEMKGPGARADHYEEEDAGSIADPEETLEAKVKREVDLLMSEPRWQVKALGIEVKGQQQGKEGVAGSLKADSIHVVLKQALDSDDKALVQECLGVTNHQIINETVRRLPPKHVTMLLKKVRRTRLRVCADTLVLRSSLSSSRSLRAPWRW